jgi:hypothetical protein
MGNLDDLYSKLVLAGQSFYVYKNRNVLRFGETNTYRILVRKYLGKGHLEGGERDGRCVRNWLWIVSNGGQWY